MRSDRETKLVAWVASIAVALMSIWLFAVAIEGILTHKAPTLGKYSPIRYISGVRGMLLGASYIFFSIGLMFSAISIKRYAKNNNYSSIAKWCVFAAAVIMITSLLFAE